jgi:hypothetical protein
MATVIVLVYVEGINIIIKLGYLCNFKMVVLGVQVHSKESIAIYLTIPNV